MNNRNIVIAGMVAVAFLMAAILWWIITPSWTFLYPNPLTNSAQKAIVQQLAINGFDYKIDGKDMISVKSDDFKKIQLLLSEKGLPEESSNGLEIFSNSDYGLSEFAQSINYQRGMEEELSRTIKRIKGIKDARVHLTIKKDSLFEERKQKPKASVVISPYDGEILSSRNINSIQEIVSAAVANLEPANVVVITDSGIVLSSDNNSTALNENGQSLEEKYTRQVVDLLGQILPKDSFKVSVNVIIDQKKKVTVEENYYPDMSTGKGFLLKKRVTTSGQNSRDSNNGNTSNMTNEEEYAFSKERSEIVYPEKEIRKIAVGLVISYELPADQLKSLETLIFNSLAMDPDRGDSVSSYFSNSQVAVEGVPGNIEVVSQGIPMSADTGVYKNVLHKNIEYIFMVALLFFVTSIVFMALFLIARKSNSKDMTEADFNQLAKSLSDWNKIEN